MISSVSIIASIRSRETRKATVRPGRAIVTAPCFSASRTKRGACACSSEIVTVDFMEIYVSRLVRAVNGEERVGPCGAPRGGHEGNRAARRLGGGRGFGR